RAALEHFWRPGRPRRRIRWWSAPTSTASSRGRTAAFDPTEVFHRESVHELVRDVARLDPAGTAANRRVTEVVVQTNKLRIEVFDREPQIPDSATDVSICRMRVIHGGRAV